MSVDKTESPILDYLSFQQKFYLIISLCDQIFSCFNSIHKKYFFLNDNVTFILFFIISLLNRISIISSYFIVLSILFANTFQVVEIIFFHNVLSYFTLRYCFIISLCLFLSFFTLNEIQVSQSLNVQCVNIVKPPFFLSVNFERKRAACFFKVVM